MTALDRLRINADVLYRRLVAGGDDLQHGAISTAAYQGLDDAYERAQEALNEEEDRLRSAGQHPDQLAERAARVEFDEARQRLDEARTQDAIDLAAQRYRAAIGALNDHVGWGQTSGWLAGQHARVSDDGRGM